MILAQVSFKVYFCDRGSGEGHARSPEKFENNGAVCSNNVHIPIIVLSSIFIFRFIYANIEFKYINFTIVVAIATTFFQQEKTKQMTCITS
jgi:hypothetical protein